MNTHGHLSVDRGEYRNMRGVGIKVYLSGLNNINGV